MGEAGAGTLDLRGLLGATVDLAIEPGRTLPAGPGVECALHDYHSPEVMSFDEHHLQPTGKPYYGPEDGEKAVTCPTGHRNVHIVLRVMEKYGGPDNVPGDVRRGIGRATWLMALRAWSTRP
jgi:hypothetical protein